MPPTDALMYLMCRDGGFLVCSARGNWAYAYPGSDFARMARSEAKSIAVQMAAKADTDAAVCSPYVVQEHNRHLSQSFAAELAEREPQL